MRILIWGSGALGILWYRRLRVLGAQPILIARTKRQRNRIKRDGVTVTDEAGTHQMDGVPVFTADASLPQADWVWLMVKQTALDHLWKPLQGVCGPDTEVWFWQNGWHPHWPLTRGAKSWWNVVTTEGALRQGDHAVHHTGVGSTWVGSLVSPGSGPDLQRVPGLERWIVCAPQIRDRIWEKLAINSVINPLTAIWGVKNGQLIKRQEFPPLAKAMLQEAVQAANLHGVRLSSEKLWEQVITVCQRTANNRSSMLQDVESGRKTEIDFINGAIVQTGEKNGVAFPLNRAIIARVHCVERKSR
jgi:2-dehydropantoate 2-reductase